MKMKNTILLSLALVLFISGPANSRTITVRLDDTGDFNNIQAAINDSNDGDVVLVADGTYTGEGNRDIDFKGKAIIVRSKSGPEDCIIDCNGSETEPHRGFYFHNGEDNNSVLDGFTITNGYIKVYGSGIYCTGSSPTITNCRINDNWTYSSSGISCWWESSPKITNCTISGNNGGGILCWESNPTITDCNVSWNTDAGIYCDMSSSTIVNCTINGNSGVAGGGIYCKDSSPNITNCTISDNSAGGLGGGGIYCEDSSPTITNCTITGNSSVFAGGGIFCKAWEDSPTTIIDCTISGNSAGYTGGGICCYWSDLNIANCTISGNSAEGRYGGGGIYFGDQPMSIVSKPGGTLTMTDCIITQNVGDQGAGILLLYITAATVTNCTISGNTANEDGGGIACGWSANETTITNCKISGNAASQDGGGIYCRWESSPTITNCTIGDNRADHAGGGIYSDESSPTINNCILWGDAAPDGPELALGSSYTTVTVGFSDVQGGQAAVYIEPGCTLNWGTGNIDTDPLFVQPGYWDANGTADDANDDFWVDGDYHLFKGSECIDAGTNNPAGGLPVTDLDGKARPFDGDGDGIAIADMGAYEYVPRIPAEVDIKPDTINLTSKGKWITCHIRLPDGYNVADIDLSSVRLEDEIEAELAWVNEQGQIATARFGRSEVQCILEAGEAELTVSGELTDGTVFEGTDVIRVIDKGGRKLAK